MNLKVNDKDYQVADSPDRLLLWVLRDELGLTGTKYGCGEGICGCCEIHVDGVVRRSCITRLSEVRGKAVRTIEGLEAADGELHPVQRAFLDERAPQCGWCMSGQVMRATAFLESNHDPSEEAIVDEMSHNLCRCGSYQRILNATLKAARVIADGGGKHE